MYFDPCCFIQWFAPVINFTSFQSGLCPVLWVCSKTAEISVRAIGSENGQEFSLMSGERSFLNLFRDSRTPLDSLIYFVIVQCPSDETTWYIASCARNGYWRNRSRCFITKLISDFGHCVLFDIFLFNRFYHVRFFVIRSWFRFKSLNVFRSSELMYEWYTHELREI